MAALWLSVQRRRLTRQPDSEEVALNWCLISCFSILLSIVVLCSRLRYGNTLILQLTTLATSTLVL